jgi:O-antigen/teichoic acid export membrane protein
MPLYDRSRARRSLFDTVAYRIASQAATVLGYVVLVRAMSKQDFGILNLLYSFIPLVGTAASLGLEQTLRRFQPEYLSHGNLGASAWLVNRIATLRLIVNLVMIGGVLLAWNRVAPYFDLGPYRVQFEFFSILILVYFQSQILQLTLAAHMLHRFSVGSVALLSFGKLIWYSALALAGALTLRTAIYADTLAYLVVYVFLRVSYRRECRSKVPNEAQTYRPSSEERKRLLKYSLFNNFNDAGTLFLDSRIDNFFIAAFMNPVAVGIYSFYMRLNEMALNVLPGRLFDNIIQPMFFAVKPAEADERLPQYFSFLLNANLVVLWPVVAFSLAYHTEIVRVVFGGKFVEQSWLLPLILGFALINAFSTPVSLVAQYEEKAHIQLLSKIFAVYNVLALLALIPRFGLYGAALAIGSAQIFKNLFIWWHVRRRAVWLNAGASLSSGVALWGMTVGVCYGLKAALPPSSVLNLVVGLLIVASVSLIHFRGPVLCASDRAILLRLFHGKEVRLLQWLGLVGPVADGTLGTR